MPKQKSLSQPQKQTISKFFLPGTSTSMSPYKDLLKDVHTNRVTVDDDFKPSPVFNRVSKIKPTVKAKKKTTRKAVSKVPSVKSFFKDVFANVDVNPDHLQTAIALSESEQDEKSQSTSPANDSLVVFKQALEQYGVKCGKQVPVEKRKAPVRKNHKSKFRFVTPILHIRTAEERETLIATKISQILSENQNKSQPNTNSEQSLVLFSHNLDQTVENKLFHFGNLSLEELNQPNRLYVISLNFDQAVNTCGCLLKNWDLIIGREKSPERTESQVEGFHSSMMEIHENCENSQSEKPETSAGMDASYPKCVSPDLFESICEDFTIPAVHKEQEVYDLTQSSEESNQPAALSENMTVDSHVSFDFENIEGNLENEPQSSKEINSMTEENCVQSESAIIDVPRISSEEPEDVYLSDATDDSSQDNCNLSLNIQRESMDADLNSEKSDSQDGIVISDDELNYSSLHTSIRTDGSKTKKYTKYDSAYFDDLGCDEMSSSDESNADVPSPIPSTSHSSEPGPSKIETDPPIDQFDDTLNMLLNRQSIIQELEAEIVEPIAIDSSSNESEGDSTKTPRIKGQCVKSGEATPMRDYDRMDSPNIAEELNKFGIKPMKRRRGVQLLKYIYESTHPAVPVGKNDSCDTSSSEDECEKRTKKPKMDTIKDVTREASKSGANTIEIVGDIVKDSDELIFERTFSKKIKSCRIPLQIAWFNFLSCNPEMYKTILKYEPLQVEVVHSMLKEQGFKFNIQDLITFLDSHCITIRTAQWQGRRKKKPS